MYLSIVSLLLATPSNLWTVVEAFLIYGFLVLGGFLVCRGVLEGLLVEISVGVGG